MVCIYDSGVGGLTALRALRRLRPDLSVAYYGDTARVPYGTRPPGVIARYAANAFRFIETLAPEAVLIACGTVSTVALPRLSPPPFPVLGVAEAGIEQAVRGGYSRIAVLGTAATIDSGVFAAGIADRLPHARIRSLACPLFVTLAECGYTDREDPLACLGAKRCLSPLYPFDPEAILLGCTHFPLLSGVIAELFPRAVLIDCGAEAAEKLAGSLPPTGRTGEVHFYVSNSAAHFCRSARTVYGEIRADQITELREE